MSSSPVVGLLLARVVVQLQNRFDLGSSGIGELLANTLAVRNVTVAVLDIKPIVTENCAFDSTLLTAITDPMDVQTISHITNVMFPTTKKSIRLQRRSLTRYASLTSRLLPSVVDNYSSWATQQYLSITLASSKGNCCWI